MANYKNNPTKKEPDKRKDDFLDKIKTHLVNENKGLTSSKLDSDELAKVYDKFQKTYRPAIRSKNPSDFAFFGSAEQYYHDAAYNIVNYFPFDGTREEVINWHQSSSLLDLALYKQFWPSAVGSFKANYSEYVDFYAGPNKISEAEFVGKLTHSETGLHINPASGSTVEFWLKKEGYDGGSYPTETIFDIGSYPGKLDSAESARIKLDLVPGSTRPFRLTYNVGGLGPTNLQIGATTLNDAAVADSKWHHYSLKVFHSASKLHIKLFVDGEVNSEQQVSVANMPTVKNYLGGTIAATQGSTAGTFSGSISNFRFWKGQRTSREITRFFDKKIYASDTTSENYSSRLGLNFRFNKPSIGVDTVDSLVVDSSGNDIVGRIKNYDSSTTRLKISAITQAESTTNTESGDPILDWAHPNVQTLTSELKAIGRSYDNTNQNIMHKFIPEWANQEVANSQNPSEFQILLHLMASEFDQIKVFLDSTRHDLVPNYQETNQLIESNSVANTGSINYSSNIFIGCTDDDIENASTNGYRGDRPQRVALNMGLRHQLFFQKAENSEDTVEGITENIKHTETISEVRQAFAQRCAVECENLMKRKGTFGSIRSIYSISGLDNDDLTDMFLVPNAELFLNKQKLESHISKINSISFTDNQEATLFLTSSKADELTYIPHRSGSKSAQYTYEGGFMFPSHKVISLKNTKVSAFGIKEVSGTLGDLTQTDPDHANITVLVEKQSINSDKARFLLESNSGIIAESLTSSYIDNVYDGSRWNLSVRVRKATSEPFISNDSDSYELVFAGYNYILDTLAESFYLTSSISKAKYELFNESQKTVFIGANRTNVTGSIINKTDIRSLNFSAWNEKLTDEDLHIRARNPLAYGSIKVHEVKEFSTGSKTHSYENAVFRTQFSNVQGAETENPFVILDETSGSVDTVHKKHNFKSLGFSTNLSKVVQTQHVSHVRNVPLLSFKGVGDVEISNSMHEDYTVSTKPQVRIFSFEKSAYQSISRDMYNFLAGVSAYNNIIGEPVNKYRKSYKLLNSLREKFFSTVSNDVDFERYLSYYRWMDSAVGFMLEQMIPGSSFSNVGIENVVESHALERNKYDHKYNRFERKEPNIETNILAINESLYDWEHGHFNSDEDEHCLWQKDRKEVATEREQIQKVLTTKVSGSTYVLRNLVKPYRYTVDRQDILSIGDNRKANKIKDLYKIVNTGKQISINKDDIYDFKKCDDVLNPQEEEIYVAKTNTTETEGYLDADADLILPFTLYSSSVGTDFDVFKQDLKITNNLEREASFDNVRPRSMSNKKPHRNVKVGTSGSSRPEAYNITASSTHLIVKETTGLKSMFHKGAIGSSLYHIGNVKTTTTPLVIGNYSKDYEIVQIAGRTQNNNFLVENEGSGLTGSLAASLHLSGVTDFPAPDRTKREHVIVNRFSSPGSPESSGLYGLDREAAEFSIYSTVNYRNSLIRDTYNLLSGEKSERFGYRSGSATQASIHMTNRNLRRGKSTTQLSSSDNYFAQHQIPNHEFSYSWVTASAIDGVYDFLGKNGNIQFQHTFDISGSIKSSQTINFLSASDLGVSNTFNVAGIGAPKALVGATPAAGVPGWHGVDFVGTNYLIFEPVSSSLNHLGYPNLETNFYPFYFNPSYSAVGSTHGKKIRGTFLLNALINNRQGPSGWPTWKQIRGGNHPVVRDHKRNNTFSIVMRGNKAFASSYPGTQFSFYKNTEDNNSKTKPRIVKNYKEIMATCKFNPITVSVHNYRTEAGIEFLVDGPMPRNLSQAAMSRMWFNDEFFHEFITKFQNSRDTLLLPSLSLRATAQNVVTGFANQEMADTINFDEKPFLQCKNLEIINDFISVNNRSSNSTYLEANYIETIYPREINTFTKEARNRDLFAFFGWDSLRTNRHLALSGNLNYPTSFVVDDGTSKLFLNTTPITHEKEFKKSYFDKIDLIDLNSLTAGTPNGSIHITASTWVLDSRKDLLISPYNLQRSYFNDSGPTFLTNYRSRANLGTTFGGSSSGKDHQGVRGEGILQNDFSLWPMGINVLRGAPPFAPVYNRRIPQTTGVTSSLLSGEAPWEASSSAKIGPFYDKYSSYAEEVRLAGQEYSLIPEFTISRYIEDIYASGNFDNPVIGDDFLHLTGVVYHTSSDEVSIGKQFFKTYSNSDFMKYFQPFKENLLNNEFDITAGKLTLRCSAVKRLLPYRGFYPAERAVQISEIFHRNYLPESTYETEYVQNSAISETQAQDSLRIKIENTKNQVSRPLFAPGVLFNSVKTGVAVDYPIFTSSVDSAVTYLARPDSSTATINFSTEASTFTDVEDWNGLEFYVWATTGKKSIVRYFSFDGTEDTSEAGYVTNGSKLTNWSRRLPGVRVDATGLAGTGSDGLNRIVGRFQEAIEGTNGFNGAVSTSWNSSTKILTLTQSVGTALYLSASTHAKTPANSSGITYSGFTASTTKVETPVTSFTGFGLGASTCYTGSLINSTIDSGIPRISGSVERRVNFDDLLQPERLFGQTIYENEPHPSASLLYGSRYFLRAIEHSPKFGTIDTNAAAAHNSVRFSQNWQSMAESLRPYRSAINNFTSETVRFFLKDQKLQALVSRPAKPTLNSGTVYKMRVYVVNRDTSMYDRHSAFGPPVDDGNVEMTTDVLTSFKEHGVEASGSITFVGNNSAAVAMGGSGIISGIYFTTIPKTPTKITAIDLDNAIITLPVDALPGFKISGFPSGSGKNLEFKYYDRRNYSSSYSQMHFRDPTAYGSATSNALIGHASSNPYGAIVTLASDTVGASSTAIVGYYDSKTSDASWKTAVTNNVSNVESPADAAVQIGGTWYPLINVSGSTSGFKTIQELAEKTALVLNSNFSSKYSATSSNGTCSIFVETNIHESTDWRMATSSLHPGLLSVTGSGDKNLAHVFDYDGDGTGNSGSYFQFNRYVAKVNLGTSNQTIEEYVTSEEQASDSDVASGASNTYKRFLDVHTASFVYAGSAFSSGITLASASADIINLISDDINLSCSQATLDLTTPNRSILKITSSLAGTASNAAIQRINSFGSSTIYHAADTHITGGTQDIISEEDFIKSQVATVSASHGFLPYVAPFQDPNTTPYAEISFTPGETKEYTISEIIDNMSVTYHNMPAPDNSSTNTNYKEAMVLSASIDFDKYVSLYTDAYDHLGSEMTGKTIRQSDISDLRRWVIHPKWETPIMDFQEVHQSALHLKSGSILAVSGSPWKNRYQTSYYKPKPASAEEYLTSSTGMWHQTGAADPSKGYYLTIVGARDDGKASFGNLAEKVGFLDTIESPSMMYGTPESQPFKVAKLGQLAESKTVFEAVVAIPYYLTDDCDMNFFPIKSGMYPAAIQYNKAQREQYVEDLRFARSKQEIKNIKEEYEKFFESPGIEALDTIAYQLRMMNKYIFPPQLDFTRNDKVDPHVAFVFQFRAKLNSDDLGKIWQNLYPESGKDFTVAQHSIAHADHDRTDTEYITHMLSPGGAPFLKGKSSSFEHPEQFMEQDTRWLVFKVKFRAESHYSNVVDSSITDIEENVMEVSTTRRFGDKAETILRNSETEDKQIFSNYSYNWPYDYFSLVEMIKVESKVDFLSRAQGPEPIEGEQDSRRVMTQQIIDSANDATAFKENLNSAGVLFDTNIITNQLVKADTDSLTGNPNELNISVASGFSIKNGSEAIYVNGLLQVPGGSDDYVLTGNKIVFGYNLQSDDKVHVSYIKEE